jgi:hypothetical protein
MLAPGLAKLLALKCRPGIGDITQLLARLLTPFNREAPQVAAPNRVMGSGSLREFLVASGIYSSIAADVEVY